MATKLISSVKCNAKAKHTGKTCRRWAIPGKTKCKFHGGASLSGIAHPNFKHGKYSRYLPARLSERYQNARTDKDLLSLRDDIAVTEARISELLEKIDTGESGEVWKKLGVAGNAFQEAYATGNTDKLLAAVENIRVLVKDGQAETSLWLELQTLQEHRRKLTETENKMLIAKQQMISVEQLMIYIGVILDTIRTHVIQNTEKQVGTKILNGISQDFDRLTVLETGRS